MNRPPQLEIVAPNASPEEAAAVVAALEQFIRDHASTVASAAPPPASAWQTAALREGVNRAPESLPFWA